MRAPTVAAASIDPATTPAKFEGSPDLQEIDDDAPLELDDEYWEAFIPDDDYEPWPEFGDFWTDGAQRGAVYARRR